MKLRLTTVRGKLTALVAFSAIVTLTALPVLSWIMDRQLVDEVDDRVPAAVRGFGLELDGDLRDLATIVEQLSSQADVSAGLRSRNAHDVVASGRIFHEAYPQIDLVFFDVGGKRVAQIEVDAPPDDARAVPELAGLAADHVFRGVVEHGCETGAAAPPAFVIAKRVRDAGMVVACLPLDADYLKEVQQKLGVELAFVAPGSSNSIGNTEQFPIETLPQATPASTLVQSGANDWALARITPKSMMGLKGDYGVVVALEVTDIRNIVRHNLLWAMAVLVAATLLSIALGSRLASVMSRALSRVHTALQKLQNNEYAHVDMIHTGDELEDLATGFNVMVDGLKERDKLRTTFGKYMTQTVMEHLMSGKVQLGGETLTVTILFSDIRSFTTIAEEMKDAQALVRLLNEYFTEMVSIVMQENGVVDKYIGDAIMAVFGAPVSKKDDAVRAVRAAVRMRIALSDLNERLVARGITPLRTGIGIHTGVVVAGNIGSEQRMEYTVIGDAVNLASRLETSTKEMGVDVLISADTYELVKDTCVAEAIREITVKGRSEPVMTYEVRGLKDAAVRELLARQPWGAKPRELA
jgi:adenylate cyclase